MQDQSAVMNVRIQTCWNELGGSDLEVIDLATAEGRKTYQSLSPKLRDAVDDVEREMVLDLDEKRWWIIRSATYAREQFIVARHPRDGPWEGLLRNWADLLAALQSERKVSEAFTSELVGAWDRLSFFYEITKIVGQGSTLKDTLHSIVKKLSDVVPGSEGLLILSGDEQGELLVINADRVIHPGGLLEAVFSVGRPLNSSDLKGIVDEPEFMDGAHDLAIAPMYADEARVGAVGLRRAGVERFNSNDLQLLGSVADQMGALVELARSREIRESRLRLDHELTLAAQLQASLLPKELPEMDGIQVQGSLKPARRVGGDFFDVVEDREQVTFLLADVAGKGMPAALVTPMVHTSFQAQPSGQQDPARILKRINRAIFADLDRADTFVTAIVCRLQKEKPILEFASAGHIQMLAWRNQIQSFERFGATGFPLGIKRATEYELKTFQLHPRDFLLLCSDGVTESRSLSGELFGQNGLEDLLFAIQGVSANASVDCVLESLDLFTAQRPSEDDIAILLIQFADIEDTQNVYPLIFDSNQGYSASIVTKVRDFVKQIDLESRIERDDISDRLSLALTEIITNQMEHAYAENHGQVFGRLTRLEDRIVADVYDRGLSLESLPVGAKMPIDPGNAPERGYGLIIVEGLADEYAYSKLENGMNHWQINISLEEVA